MEHTNGTNNNEIHMVPLSPIPSTSQQTSYYDNIEPEFHWIRSSIRHLISLVSIHFDEFYDKTLKKKILWKRIAQEMRTVGHICEADDCDKKWRNLKKTYVNVLQKQVKGDFSSKFPYFDQMHDFLGREIDPLGMREQGLNKALKVRKVAAPTEAQRTSYYEVTFDNMFEWTESAVHLLLDLVLEHRELFKIKNCDIDSVWESIADRMVSDGCNILPEQCQRKWANLADGFRHYQNEGEATGNMPTWTFFSRVRHVINTVNVPITIVKDLKKTPERFKGSLKLPGPLKEMPRRRKRRQEFIDTGENNHNDSADNFSASLERSLSELDGLLNLTDRFDHLEKRLAEARRQKEAGKQTNSLLMLILAELRRINGSFDEGKKTTTEPLVDTSEPLQQQQEHVPTDSLNRMLYQQDEPSGLLQPDALLNMDSVTKLDLGPKPRLEIDSSDDNEGIIIVEGL